MARSSFDPSQHRWREVKGEPSLSYGVRQAGDYALTVGEDLPHLERVGPEGGLVFFGSHSKSGRLYEILDEEMNVILEVTMETLIEDWKANS